MSAILKVFFSPHRFRTAHNESVTQAEVQAIKDDDSQWSTCLIRSKYDIALIWGHMPLHWL